MEEEILSRQNYYEDMTTLQKIFAEEIWLMIFNGHLTNFTEYQRTSASSPYFHKLLLPFRTRLLFPEVVKHFTNWMMCPLYQTAHKTLLSCRQVCQKWKQGVDATFQHILNQPIPTGGEISYPNHPSSNLYHFRLRYLTYLFLDSVLIDMFFEQFDNSHDLKGSNPFPGKLICINNFNATDELTQYCEKTLELLCKYGQHILNCRFELLYTVLDMNQIVNHFSSAIKLMPNLKSLSVDIHTAGLVPSEVEKSTERVFITNPLPKLEKLDILEIDAFCPASVFSQLVLHNTHITKLILRQLEPQTFSVLFATPLINLEELQILSFCLEQDLVSLQNAPVIWSLKKLKLGISVYSKISTLDVFHLIESRWASTLTSLEVSLPQLSLQVRPLMLPHLKHLVITIRQFIPMDFILPMANSLTNLCVRRQYATDYEEGLENESIVKFFLHRYKLFQSNIWTHFPKLKHLRYSEESLNIFYNLRYYRRNDWQRFIEQQEAQ